MRSRALRFFGATVIALALASAPALAGNSGFSSSRSSATKSTPSTPAKSVAKASGFGASSGNSTVTAVKPSALGNTLYTSQASANAAKVYDNAHSTSGPTTVGGASGSGVVGSVGTAPGSYSNNGYGQPYGAPRTVVVQQGSNNGLLTGIVVGSLLSHHDTVVAAPAGGYSSGSYGPNGAPTGFASSSSPSGSSGGHGGLIFAIFLILAVAGVLFFVFRNGGIGQTSGGSAPTKKKYEL